MDDPSFDFIKILSHDLRWTIVRTLAHSDYKVQELVERLHQPQNLVSYHLKQLRDTALLLEHRSTADRRDIYYSLDIDRLQAGYLALGKALHPVLTSPSAAPVATSGRGAPQRVLFLCTENSARSQMAEGFLRHMGDGWLQAYSAGTAPSRIHPQTIRIMATRGIDIQSQRSKSISEFEDLSFDYVITVCDRAREHCPTFASGTTFIHWSLPDPALVKDEAAQIEAFEQTARVLERRLHHFIASIISEDQE